MALTYAVVTARPAEAATFNFQYSFPGLGSTPTPVSASGTLTTSDLNPANNAYTITGITGTRIFQGVTQQIVGLVSPDGFGGNDNLLFANQPFLDVSGFTYTVNGTGNAGTSSVNVFYSRGGVRITGYTEYDVNVAYFSNFSVTPVATSVPEPTFNSAEALVVLSLGGLLFKKKVFVKEQKLN